MARSIPKVCEGSLQQESAEDTSTTTISIGTAAWYSWLEQHSSFTFETPHAAFTAQRTAARGLVLVGLPPQPGQAVQPLPG